MQKSGLLRPKTRISLIDIVESIPYNDSVVLHRDIQIYLSQNAEPRTPYHLKTTATNLHSF
jgi:hypothetical protein